MTQQTMNLTTLASELLANLAFLFVDDTAASQGAEDEWLESDIAYTGRQSGVLRLQCPRGFARVLAANLLGVESTSGDADARAEGAVTEFMNILCGHYVTAMYGADATAELSIPQLIPLPQAPEACEAAPGVEAIAFVVSGYDVRMAHVCSNGKTGA